MTFVGFDLHKRYITACALDESGAILAEVRQLSTSLEAVLTWLGSLPQPVTVGMEATLYWEWVATRLATATHAVRVAHAFHVKLIWQARATTDPIDARKRAELLRVNLFPSIWLPDTATRERRQLLRGRAWLEAAPLSPVLRTQTQRLLTLHDALTAEIVGLDADVKKAAKGNPVVKPLTTRPGGGVGGALFLQPPMAAWARRALGG